MSSRLELVETLVEPLRHSPQLVEAVGGIKLLGLTSWPAALQAPFLASVARGQPVLPMDGPLEQ
jgi:hypothetical protein